MFHPPKITGATDSISVPHSRGGSAPNAAHLKGAARGLPCRSAEPQSGGAAAPIAPTFPCRHCEGAGEAEYMGLTEDRYHWRTCHVCEGSRVEAPYCQVCGSNLTCDLFCVDCDDWASLTYVERISPTRIAL